MADATMPELMERLKELSSEDLHAALAKVDRDLLAQVPVAQELLEMEQQHQAEVAEVAEVAALIRRQRDELTERDKQDRKGLQALRTRLFKSGVRWKR